MRSMSALALRAPLVDAANPAASAARAAVWAAGRPALGQAEPHRPGGRVLGQRAQVGVATAA